MTISTRSAWDLVEDVSEMVLPKERITVPEFAEREIILDIKGGYFGPWNNDRTPLLVEPAECLTDRRYDAVIVVASSQTGKTTALIDNWAFHTICVDPVDFLLIEKSENEACNHSRTRIDRIMNVSPDIDKKIVKGRSDSVYEKRTKSGVYLWIKWPTKNTLSGATVSRIALTDYDRMPDDIDGEGPAFDLAYARRTYFGTRGMVLAESSPSKPVLDPKWIPATPHEAPPTIGILGLYNTGDRRRIYSQCPHCGAWFSPEASEEAIHVPEDDDEYKAAARSSLICTKNGCLIGQEHEAKFKRDGKWVREGQSIAEDGTLEGEGRTSRRASFWLPGWFASFASWRSIITEYLLSKQQFLRTGDETSLKNAINTKIGGPYWTITQRAAADEQQNFDRSEDPNWKRRYVPEGARVIIAIVDVQRRSFEVGIIARGRDNERWILDRFGIRRTKETDEDIRPAVCLEHWNEITERVALSTYLLPDGNELRVHIVGVDSGGEAGASERAYEYWRWLPRDMRKRILLLKGVASHGGRGVSRLTYPESNRRQRPGGGRGDVPLLEIVSNRAKDVVFADLQREIPGRGYIHIPEWISSQHIRELHAETRNAKGEWKQIGYRRNELWDHLYYEFGIWDHLTRGDRINWDNPPHWLSSWGRNSNVIDKKQGEKLVELAAAPVPGPIACDNPFMR